MRTRGVPGIHLVKVGAVASLPDGKRGLGAVRGCRWPCDLHPARALGCGSGSRHTAYRRPLLALVLVLYLHWGSLDQLMLTRRLPSSRLCSLARDQSRPARQRGIVRRMAAFAMDVRKASFLPFVAIGLGIGIFIFDTVSPLQFAVAVLYVVVVLVAATSYRRRVVLMTSGACVGLTVLSYAIVHGFKIDGTAPLRSVMSLVAIGITTFLSLRILSITERLKETERQRTNLARFFSPQRVKQLLEIDTPLSAARQERAAVLFVDMIGSTAYFSRLMPDATIEILRGLLALLSASVFAHNGTIDKFLGDGLMAVFGAPRAQCGRRDQRGARRARDPGVDRPMERAMPAHRRRRDPRGRGHPLWRCGARRCRQ